jgi:hypothetical protein
MSTATLIMPKGHADGGEKKQTSTARLPVELLRQARVVAAFRNIDLGDYLVGLLQGLVSRDYRQVVSGEARPPRGEG